MSEMTVDGIDMHRFPRVVPDNLDIMDAFPLNPIPECLGPVMSDLLGQLALANAPFSGKRIACILAGADEGYGGHTIERSRSDVVDPFLMALEKVPKGAKLYGVMVTGEGPMKEKHVMPSGKAYDLLSPLLVPHSDIVVVPPNTRDVCRFIPEFMHASAYRTKVASVFQGRTIFESQVEAIRYTSLSMEDCEFVAHLRHAGLRDDIHYYLTGSSNGQSGPSVALRPGMYSDLDIIAVSDKDKNEIEARFEDIAEAWYGPLEKKTKVVNIAGSDDMVKGCIYSNPEAGIEIDFYATNRIRKALVRPENADRNYFHQLS